MQASARCNLSIFTLQCETVLWCLKLRGVRLWRDFCSIIRSVTLTVLSVNLKQFVCSKNCFALETEKCTWNTNISTSNTILLLKICAIKTIFSRNSVSSALETEQGTAHGQILSILRVDGKKFLNSQHQPSCSCLWLAGCWCPEIKFLWSESRFDCTDFEVFSVSSAKLFFQHYFTFYALKQWVLRLE